MKREFVCIVCPKSCDLTVEESGGAMHISGNGCKRGIAFAEEETRDPQRILTSTVKLTTGALLPVRSRGTVRRSDLRACVESLKSITLAPPIEIGQVVAEDVGRCGVAVVAADRAY